MSRNHGFIKNNSIDHDIVIDEALDEIHEAVDPQLDKMIDRVKSKIAERENKKLIGFWIPESDKEKFDTIQKLSKQEFGKEVQELIRKAIKRVKIEELEACG